MEIELVHPKNPRHVVRFRVARAIVDRRDLLVIRLGPGQIHDINRRLGFGHREKVDLSDLMERTDPYTFQLRNPEACRHVRVSWRPTPSMSQKINQALKNPAKALNDPELAPIVRGLFRRNQ